MRALGRNGQELCGAKCLLCLATQPGVWEWGNTIFLCTCCSSGCRRGRKDGPCFREAAGDPGVGEGLCYWGCGRPISGQTSRVSVGTCWCQAARACRKLFSRSMRLPSVWEAEMFCKKRVPQFYSAQYFLEVKGAADGSPWSPSPCAVGEDPRTVLGLAHCESSPIVVGSNRWATPRNCPRRYTFVFLWVRFLLLTKLFLM